MIGKKFIILSGLVSVLLCGMVNPSNAAEPATELVADPTLALAHNILIADRDPVFNKLLERIGVPSSVMGGEGCNFELLKEATQKTRISQLAKYLNPSNLSSEEHSFIQFFADAFQGEKPQMGPGIKMAAAFSPSDIAHDSPAFVDRFHSFSRRAKELLLRLEQVKFTHSARILLFDIPNAATPSAMGYDTSAFILFENGRVGEIAERVTLGPLETVEENLTTRLTTLIENQGLMNDPQNLAKALKDFKEKLDAALTAINDFHNLDGELKPTVIAKLNAAYGYANPTKPILESEIAQRYIDYVLAKQLANTASQGMKPMRRIGYQTAQMNQASDPLQF